MRILLSGVLYKIGRGLCSARVSGELVISIFLFILCSSMAASAVGDDRCSSLLARDPKIVALIVSERKKLARDSGNFIHELDLEKIKGVTYEVLSYLGEGVEGTVYLARRTVGRGHEFVTIKYFSDARAARLHARLMQILSDNSLRSVKLFNSRFSKSDPVIVQEYIEGMNLEKVLSTKNPLGLSRNMIAEIKKKRRQIFERFERIRSRPGDADDPASELSWRDYNLLYEFSTGDLVIIDGR